MNAFKSNLIKTHCQCLIRDDATKPMTELVNTQRDTKLSLFVRSRGNNR